ncbi:hypothetical protein EVAR_101074_1 [Eumeta japonica]|uniref:Uncharacterized protein n=1 Tax=Eumeta variegata TaxID=151549 RepID=A0A4C2AF05_EUMVA|nr:hypothetical protein EVAR_101074_1 [Eumeta japonica]
MAGLKYTRLFVYDGWTAFLRVPYAMATRVCHSPMASRHHTAIWQRSVRAALQTKFILIQKSLRASERTDVSALLNTVQEIVPKFVSIGERNRWRSTCCNLTPNM